MKRKSFVAVACAAAMIASMTSGLTVFAEETADFSGEELSILVSADPGFGKMRKIAAVALKFSVPLYKKILLTKQKIYKIQ